MIAIPSSPQTRLAFIVAVAAGLLSAPALAQQVDLDQQTRTAEVAGAEVGQRQEVDEVAPNINPRGRIDSRVQNRLQNRIRNRIDRFYDPTANATSPYEQASERAREAGQTRPR